MAQMLDALAIFATVLVHLLTFMSRVLPLFLFSLSCVLGVESTLRLWSWNP